MVADEARSFFNKHPGFWADLPIFQTRMIIKMFFPKGIDTFDELQIILSKLIALMQNSMRGIEITYDQLDGASNEIFAKVNGLQNKILDHYSKELSSE